MMFQSILSRLKLGLVVVIPFILLANAAPVDTGNHKIPVNLRVEGAEKTIFEGIVLTKGHNVTTPSIGTSIHCDGTNLGANPKSGPTCTSALDDAARTNGFPWNGTYFSEFDDIFITSIGGVTQTDTQFWGILLDYQFTPVGGCQQRVKVGDEILFAFDAFSATAFLKLKGPHVAHVNQPVTLTVTDGSTGKTVQGADVDGAVSDANGKATITFGKAGLHGVKAQKAGTIRSNQVSIVVTP
ncbi:surface cell-adhesion protein [Moniliophthora roreri MCA 2997]|uniref:Surface cell-adhesion protein n=2 Tax=Moniliophthora roreri TaxID=221103 RepID=V2X372_MONRO|nr:surface cell-adhesion protein [Moniliophthora roreri MCA 2997]KAI3596126.1 surface cell-adhesion protein [Moniliophthora roreri]